VLRSLNRCALITIAKIHKIKTLHHNAGGNVSKGSRCISAACELGLLDKAGSLFFISSTVWPRSMLILRDTEETVSTLMSQARPNVRERSGDFHTL
jgi:hypothetical protein